VQQRRDPIDHLKVRTHFHHRPNWNLEFHLSFASSLTFPWSNPHKQHRIIRLRLENSLAFESLLTCAITFATYHLLRPFSDSAPFAAPSGPWSLRNSSTRTESTFLFGGSSLSPYSTCLAPNCRARSCSTAAFFTHWTLR
jgi:hypothetical protein